MTVRIPQRASGERVDPDTFAAFVARHEPRLLQALVATYGPVDGREATVDALSWAWEHWDRIGAIDNVGGYLYRVGQSSTRKFAVRAAPRLLQAPASTNLPDIEPGLERALSRLPNQQRVVVLLVHAYGWAQIEVARLLDIAPSTVAAHLSRAMSRLRDELEDHGDR